MKEIIIWHNPRCSKSRQALVLLEQAQKQGQISLSIKYYLKEIPHLNELKEVFKFLGFVSVQQWMRQTEQVYRDLNINKIEDQDSLLGLMQKYPVLIQRAVVIDKKAKKALIARPVEKVFEILKD